LLIIGTGPDRLDRSGTQRDPPDELTREDGMADYTATAISEGDYWVIDVPGVGTTRAATVDDIEEMAVDLVIAKTHTAPQDVHVTLRIV
jgi:hypothetical protein